MSEPMVPGQRSQLADDPSPVAGVHANFVEVSHNEYEFCLDFAPLPAPVIADLMETLEANWRRSGHGTHG